MKTLKEILSNATSFKVNEDMGYVIKTNEESALRNVGLFRNYNLMITPDLETLIEQAYRAGHDEGSRYEIEERMRDENPRATWTGINKDKNDFWLENKSKFIGEC